VAASSLSTPLSIHFTYIPEQIMELASRLQTPDLLLLGSGSTSYCVPHAAKTILKYLYAKCVESRHAECNSRVSIWWVHPALLYACQVQPARSLQQQRLFDLPRSSQGAQWCDSRRFAAVILVSHLRPFCRASLSL
jgi:hypothetical protein